MAGARRGSSQESSSVGIECERENICLVFITFILAFYFKFFFTFFILVSFRVFISVDDPPMLLHVITLTFSAVQVWVYVFSSSRWAFIIVRCISSTFFTVFYLSSILYEKGLHK